jgi:L-aspartate oxidase
MLKFDALIIGSGLAGLTLALKLADKQKVAVITKRAILDGASAWAQGGIAAVLSPEDSLEDHIRDTIIAGAGLCDPVSTRYVVENGKAAIEWLINSRRWSQPPTYHSRSRCNRPRSPAKPRQQGVNPS